MTLDIKFYLSIFWRRFPYFLVVATLIGAIGVSIASVLPPTFRSEAILLIESPQIPTDMASSTVRSSPAEEVNIIRERITARASLIDMANRLNVYQGRAGMSPDEVVADMRSNLSFRVTGIGPRSPGAPAIRVSFTHRDAQMATRVVNDIVAMIERENADMRRGLAGQTLQFFRDEVNRLSEEISIQRARILEYRLENRDRLPETLEFRRSRVTELESRVRQMQRDDVALEQRREELVALFQSTGRLSNEPTPLERELAQAKNQLDSALRLYSAQNPRVRVIQARVEELEGTLSQQAGNQSEAAIAEFERLLASIDQSRTVLAEERAVLEEQIDTLQETINGTAVVGIRLSELERQLSATQSQHDGAQGRLAQAEMGERIEFLAKGRRITVLEQASVPSAPASPNRPQIAAAGVGGGLAAGLALVALLELLNRSIRRPIEITRKMGITPIATIPFVRSRRQEMARRAIIIGTLLIILVGVPATLWGLHTYYLPLDVLMDRVMQRTGLAGLLNNFR